MVKVIHKNPALSDEKNEQTEEVLKKLRHTSIEHEAEALGRKNDLPYVDLQLFPLENEEVSLIPEADAKRLGLVLFKKQSGEALVALQNPTSKEALEYLQKFAGEYGLDLRLYIASLPSLEKAWKTYENHPLLESLDLMRVSLQGEDLEKFESDFGELLNLKGDVSRIPTSRIIEVILAGAHKLRASDIHFEPEEEKARLRYRIDGLLQEIGHLPKEIYRLALSRIKMLSKMKLNIRDRAQDGHFFIDLSNTRIDIRVNVIPGQHGENINMRLLTREDAFVPVEELGLRGQAYEEVKKQVAKPNGMILNTGPTGSGKTTTLYSLLGNINDPSLKIITIEDPIEYVLPGVVQTEVSKDKNYTFGQALRAIVRQDPDIVLVGEIRDEETADVSINAALTGHLVFTTLHTNNAAASIARMLELGVKPSLISTAVNVFIAQRLVRILCPHCKETYIPAEKTIAAFKKLLSLIPKEAKVEIPTHIKYLYKPVGCKECNFTGYRGRKGIFEVFPVTNKMADLISSLASEQEIQTAAVAGGMLTMSQDGLLKVLDGLTTMDEVWRSAGKEEELEDLYADILADTPPAPDGEK